MGQLDNSLPIVTDEHRHRAFQILAMHGWTYEAAMADVFRCRIINVCAAALRTKDWERNQCRSVERIKRVQLGADGHPIGWITQLAPGELRPIVQPDLFSN